MAAIDVVATSKKVTLAGILPALGRTPLEYRCQTINPRRWRSVVISTPDSWGVVGQGR
jgi:hypothetical protein